LAPAFQSCSAPPPRGDEGAFERLWYDLQPRLLRYFRVIAPGTAEDLASETWLAVIGAIGRFQGNEPAFRAWVFTIARHKVLDWRRRAARRGTEDLPANGLIEEAAPDDPAADALEGFSTRAALAEVAALPADQAEAIVLRVVAGLAVDRVAEIMGSGRARSGYSPTVGCAGWPSGSAPTRARTSGGWCNPLAVTPVRPVAVLCLKVGLR
jgi:RNA polymerase sigma-70 factor (ECF subfamily)